MDPICLFTEKVLTNTLKKYTRFNKIKRCVQFNQEILNIMTFQQKYENREIYKKRKIPCA